MNADSIEDWFNPQVATFGDRVAGAREQAGMTQKDLAERLGIKLKTLKSWEDDLSEPRANKLSMMAGVLNVSLTWLLSGEGDGPLGPVLSTAAAPQPGKAADVLSEIHDVRAQLASSSGRLAKLEDTVREMLRAEPVD